MLWYDNMCWKYISDFLIIISLDNNRRKTEAEKRKLKLKSTEKNCKWENIE